MIHVFTTRLCIVYLHTLLPGYSHHISFSHRDGNIQPLESGNRAGHISIYWRGSNYDRSLFGAITRLLCRDVSCKLAFHRNFSHFISSGRVGGCVGLYRSARGHSSVYILVLRALAASPFIEILIKRDNWLLGWVRLGGAKVPKTLGDNWDLLWNRCNSWLWS